MAKNVIKLFDDKDDDDIPTQSRLRDSGLDLGEKSSSESETNQEITPKQLEKQINIVQEREKTFDETHLGNNEQIFLNKKPYQTKKSLELVQKEKLFEREEETRARVEEKFKIILDNLLQKMISAKKRFPELLSALVYSLEDDSVKEQREALEEALEVLQQLKIDLRGVAQFYFSEGVKMLQDYRKAYKSEFNDTIKPRIQEYYLRFGHSTNHVPSPQEFSGILVSDIVDITSGKYHQEGFTIEETEGNITRLLNLIKKRENKSQQNSVATVDEQKRQDEEEELKNELKVQAEDMTNEQESHEEQIAEAA